MAKIVLIAEGRRERVAELNQIVVRAKHLLDWHQKAAARMGPAALSNNSRVAPRDCAWMNLVCANICAQGGPAWGCLVVMCCSSVSAVRR
jgi:hypothetical protein